jgi:AmmeMemoRadiSam system protein B
MASVRPPAVAGTFYPASARALAAAIRGYLDAAAAGDQRDEAPKAIIAPHAGYVYSGPVAASAYRRLQPLRGIVSRVVLIGPAHYVRLTGLAVPEADGFATPLGTVPLDGEAVGRILGLKQVRRLESAHAPEHSLEVHLPFLQCVLGAFRLVPIVVGETSAEAVAEVLNVLWGGKETLIVVSSDLSHYHDYRTARRLDADTSRAIEAGDVAAIGYDQACGAMPIRGLLTEAARRRFSVRAVDVRSSGDTAGPHDRVVGYGAYVLTPAR